jgi:hypothetical protein
MIKVTSFTGAGAERDDLINAVLNQVKFSVERKFEEKTDALMKEMQSELAAEIALAMESVTIKMQQTQQVPRELQLVVVIDDMRKKS